nr:putative RNA-directed DNA polymerase, eukaryota, reverse transcriptase zinc-binding domain protein [Tanacetum cinerariifolium]
MQEAVRGVPFDGVKVGLDDIEVSYLQYANDTIFVKDWNRRNIISLMKLFKCFQMASGLKVNINKISLFGIGVKMEEVEGWATSLRCRHGFLPFLETIENWNTLMQKFKNKLEIWKARGIGVRMSGCGIEYEGDTRLNDGGSFTVKGLRDMVDSKIPKPPGSIFETSWCKLIPKKCASLFGVCVIGESQLEFYALVVRSQVNRWIIALFYARKLSRSGYGV